MNVLGSSLRISAAFNFVDEDMSGCLDSEEWRRFLDRFQSTVTVINMRSMFLHLDKVIAFSSKVLSRFYITSFSRLQKKVT